MSKSSSFDDPLPHDSDLEAKVKRGKCWLMSLNLKAVIFFIEKIFKKLLFIYIYKSY